MNNKTIFHSKLLLFGEYGLIFNAKALSVPFSMFSGFLDFDIDKTNTKSSAEMARFYSYLVKNNVLKKLNNEFDLAAFSSDLKNNLYFNSNIPQQYGLGSSGALIASLYSRYTNFEVLDKSKNITKIKNDLSLLESYFHGQSSGSDPLVSLYNLPLLIDSENKITNPEFDITNSDLQITLVDTETRGPTEPLVKHFFNMMTDNDFRKLFNSGFIKSNNDCIDNLMCNNLESFYNSLENLVLYELEYFSGMIPVRFLSIIKNLLAQGIYIKLLGSGGGGYLLAFSKLGIEINEILDEQEFKYISVVKPLKIKFST